MLMPNIKILFADLEQQLKSTIHVTTGYCHFETVIIASERKCTAIFHLRGVLFTLHG